MKNKLDMLTQESLSITLKDEERSALRDSLIAYMNTHAPSEEQLQTAAIQEHQRSSRMTISLLTILIAALIIGIIISTLRSQPGDFFYFLKALVLHMLQ